MVLACLDCQARKASQVEQLQRERRERLEILEGLDVLEKRDETVCTPHLHFSKRKEKERKSIYIAHVYSI